MPDDERTLVVPTPPNLEALTRVEIDMAIATAKKYRRSVAAFRAEALAMATIDRDTAEECYYVLERKDGDGRKVRIEGPSVRLAEICLIAWGNARVAAFPIGEDEHFVRVRGVGQDLEKNVTISRDITRRITRRDGRRYSDDMVAVTQNAAASIAFRNAVFEIVPRVFVNQLFEACKKAAKGKGEQLAERRDKALAYFGKLGIAPERVYAKLEIDGAEQFTEDHLENLNGLRTALKDGDTTLAEEFPSPKGTSQSQSPGDQPTDRAGKLAKDLKQGSLMREPGEDDR